MNNKKKEEGSNLIRDILFDALIILFAPIKKIIGCLKNCFYDLSVKIHAKREKKDGSLKKSKRAQTIFLFVILFYPILHVCVFYIGVNLNSIVLAFQKYDSQTNIFSFTGFENFQRFFLAFKYETLMLTSLKNSILVYVCMLVIFFPLNILFSFFIYKKLPLAGFFKIVLFLPQIISSIVITLMFKYFVENGIPWVVEQFTGVRPLSLLANVDTRIPTLIFYGMWAGFGGSIILYTGSMSRVPQSVIEYAQIDGISIWKEFWHITVPLIYPTIVTFLVVGIAGFFTSQMSAYNFYGGQAPGNISTLGYFFFIKVVGAPSMADYPYASATGLLFTLCAAPVTLLVKTLLEKFGPNTEY